MFSDSLELNGREVHVESGEVARQASGSVILRCGDAVIFAAVTADRHPTRLNYMPLTCEYRLRYSAAGRIPGARPRREGQPSEAEILVSRLIDRSIRPFFPATWNYDTQLVIHPLSHDDSVDHAVLAALAGVAALTVSDIPWDGPVATLRYSASDGELELLPTPGQLVDGDLDLLVTVGQGGIVMAEGDAKEVSEDLVLAAFDRAPVDALPILQLLEKLRAHGPIQRTHEAPEKDRSLAPRARELGRESIVAALAVDDKLARYAALDAAKEDCLAALDAESDGGLSSEERECAVDALESLKKERIRGEILEGRRIGRRGPAEIRDISVKAGWLPSCHGSSLFTRGETQVIVTCTMGGERDAQPVETLDGHGQQRFLLHYSFPPYCVGEVKPIRGPGRREVGHGNLARRALAAVLPDDGTLHFTLRLESLVTESNGSSSMATACGGSLALLDAGIALKRPVAGIAMGLVKEGERHVVLSDILGDEDHVGDMDFKVCGTTEGVTAIQLDNKLGAVPRELMASALEQARVGRLSILEVMATALSEPRAAQDSKAPRFAVLSIEPYRIGSLVGGGGRTIKGLQAELNVDVSVNDDGKVTVRAPDAATLKKCEERVRDLAGIPRMGEVCNGTVVSVQPFGTFVRLFEGIDGLLRDEREVVGRKVKVTVAGVDERGRLELSKA